MSINKALLDSVSSKFENGLFDRFIHTVCFPKFKNFVTGATIQFRFPITIVVGPNGGGKSSILQAVWGMPQGYSTSRFWFSTPVDPIDFNPHDRNRFWYSHYIKELGCVVQTRKITGNKNHGYWEPTRPALKDGMKPMPKKTVNNADFMSPTGDRWTSVVRVPHYFNPKGDTSAFERFFNSVNLSSLLQRQDYFIRYSAKLKGVINSNETSCKYYGIEKVDKNFILSVRQLSIVNSILQKAYKSARYISHKFYDRNVFSPSVIFETNGLNYSECFAGSGELAVVNFVLAMDRLEKYDLLLLDEPETSLHPGAQERLIEYLLKIVNERLIQVIISTHSEMFVKLLPSEALVVLDESAGVVNVRPNPRRPFAFYRLGAIDSTRIVILAEDRLLQKFVERSVQRLPKEDKKRITVEASDLGVSEMLSNQIRAHIQGGAKALMVIDGDQKAVADIFSKNVDELSPSQKAAAIKDLGMLHVSIVGGATGFDSWMRWCKDRVLVLDELCPERIYLSLIKPEHTMLQNVLASNKDFKSALRASLLERGDDIEPVAAASTFKHILGDVTGGSHVDTLLQTMAERIQVAIAQFDD